MRPHLLTGLTSAVLFLNSIIALGISARAAGELSSLPAISSATNRDEIIIRGTLSGPRGEGLAGASIRYLIANQQLGVIADSLGQFQIRLPKDVVAPLAITIRSIGYQSTTITVELPAKPDEAFIQPLKITLAEESTNVPDVTVTSPYPIGQAVQGAEVIRQRSRQSLVPTNLSPTLTDPLIARPGSMHSGQIRLLGTNPVYQLNGQSIGQDPNHFEALTILPSTVIVSSELNSLGTSAEHRQLAAIELNSTPKFEPTRETEIQASTIEVTGTSRFASDKFAGVVSLRQAVINQVLGDFSANKAINSIPPTTFTDLYGSGAVRLSRQTTLSFDQFAGQDDLRFNTSDLFDDPAAGRIDMNQTSTDFISLLRLKHLAANSHWSLGVSRRSTDEAYNAVPSSSPARLTLDLSGKSESYGITGEGGMNFSRGLALQAGFEAEKTTNRESSLSQRSWNFLPPFWNTDNPHPYQNWLNDHYATLNLNQSGTSAGVFVGVTQSLGDAWLLEGGLRGDYFNELKVRSLGSYRVSVTHQLARQTTLLLFRGTSAESPVSGLLEPYQVLVRDHLNELEAIRTTLTSASIRHRGITVSAFSKTQTSLPVLAPKEDSGEEEYLLGMTSSGSADFWGGSVSMKAQDLLLKSLSLDASYTYSQSWRRESGISYAHELHAPHRFEGSLNYQPEKQVRLGFSFMARTGYPYSPLASIRTSQSRSVDPTVYSRTISVENSLTFPAHGYLNFFGEYQLGRVIVFGSIANVTNRANALVSHPRGFLYDTSLLPTIGVKLTI